MLALRRTATASLVPSFRPKARYFCSSDPQAGHRPISEEQRERTFIAIKPDAVQRGLVGEIISRFERRGFKLVGIKIQNVTRQQAQARTRTPSRVLCSVRTATQRAPRACHTGQCLAPH